MNAPATRQETSAANHAALPDEWMDRLFSRLSAMYGSKFADLWRGCNLAEVKTVWAKDLGGMSREELAAGVVGCRGRDWPPTLPEFLKLCRPPVDFGAALTEAIAQTIRRKTGEDVWSSKAIFWAAQAVTSFELENRTRRDLEPLWREAFGRELAKGAWPDIPERATALPAPGETHTKAVADGAIERMATAAAKPPRDPLLWARNPRSQQALDGVIAGAKKHEGLRLVLADLVAEGVASDEGKLLRAAA